MSRDAIGRSKYELDTPALVLDSPVLKKNVALMQAHAGSCGKALRPHAKTHKCSRIARVQIEAGAVGVCAAKVSEAAALVDGGIGAVLVTSPVVTPRKIGRLLDCLERAPELMTVLDDAANACALDAAARRRGLRLGVLVDLDPGLGRTGVSFDRVLALARAVHACDGLRLRGIQCYAGHLQHVPKFEERSQRSLACMQAAARCVAQLREAGLPCEIFSGAGTGTYDIDTRIPEVTELQVGSYALMDAEYVRIGSAAAADRFTAFQPALTLLTAVISANQATHVTVDAGLKALYHHGDTPFVVYPPELAGVTYDWFGDEHGKIVVGESAACPALGTVLELVVSHCDPTINLFEELFVVRDGTVVDVWPIDLRGRSQ